MPTQSDRAESAPGRLRQQATLVGVAAVAVAMYFVRLGRLPLADWDEALYAEVSKESLRMREWLTPYWTFQPFLVKPPLTYWVRTALFRCFGVTEFWARAESAAAGVAVVLLTFGLARRIWGMRAGVFAALVLLSIREFDDYARQAMCDVPLCLCIYLALYGYVRLREEDRARCRAVWWYLICAATGLGAMVKGPAVIIAPAAILIDCLTRRKEPWPLSSRESCLGVLLFGAIVAPWHLWISLRYGRAFLAKYLGQEVIARTLQVLDGHHGKPFYYFRWVARAAFPWSILLPFAAARSFRSQWQHRLPWIVMLVTLGLYSQVATKMTNYVLPLYPAMAVAMGGFLAEFSERRRALQCCIFAALTAGVLIAFAKLLSFPGIPGLEEKVRLALVARKSPERGALLLVQREPDELNSPAVIFYSDRMATELIMPQDAHALADLAGKHGASEAILDKRVLPQLLGYRIQPIAQSGELLYAVISPPVSPPKQPLMDEGPQLLQPTKQLSATSPALRRAGWP